jgi:SWI/SNF-related matrix-associated actin-dependent regulator 1 of chromatin subfamily A
MGGAANPSFLRAKLAERLALVLDDVERAAGEIGKHARQECAEQLNRAARRFWQADDLAALADTLADAAAQFAAGAAVVSIEQDVVKMESIRPAGEAWLVGTQTALDAAPALRAAMGSREPVIAAAAEGELGRLLPTLAIAAGDDRVAVFPVLSHSGVPALVCAWGSVEAAAMELLAKMAGEEWDRVSHAIAEAAAEAAAAAEAEATAAAAAAEAEAAAQAEAERAARAQAEPSWDSLSADEQRLHLRAQRSARVRVAQWRLREGVAVRSGRERGDLYGELAGQIDEARESFHSEFFAHCPSMVDYLHLEMVHTLAHDDAELLGKDYPGPLL